MTYSNSTQNIGKNIENQFRKVVLLYFHTINACLLHIISSLLSSMGHTKHVHICRLAEGYAFIIALLIISTLVLELAWPSL